MTKPLGLVDPDRNPATDLSDALTACGLPQAWRGSEQWRILSTDFGVGEEFFQTLNAWRADPNRPERLHFCALVTTPLPDLIDGLPGFHRLAYEGGRVTLTLCVASRRDTLRHQLQELDFHADTAWTDTHIHAHLKTLARCCARGSSLLLRLNVKRYGTPSPSELLRLRKAIRQCGWVEGVADTAGTSSDLTSASLPPTALVAQYAPAWAPRRAAAAAAPVQPARQTPGHAIVIGAGVAGAAMAHSLARRGWNVTVLDAAAAPAQGASALPAGLAVPQVSPDDNVLSRLSRNGLALLTQFAHEHLRAGIDWSPSGVMEHLGLGAPGARPAPKASDATDGGTLWHPSAAWFKPVALVNAWLDHPRICWLGNQSVQGLRTTPAYDATSATWQILGLNDAVLAQGDLVVVCAALASRKLLTGLPCPLPLQAVRGVASWALHGRIAMPAAPTEPVNGHGSYISRVPLGNDGTAGDFWIAGAGYERDQDNLHIDAAALMQHHAVNLHRLSRLVPSTAAVSPTDANLHAFIGIRCATPDRLPVAGAIAGQPGLWVSTGMGSRGLTFALLCAELIAAQLHGEPLPVEARLARALSPQRFDRALDPSSPNPNTPLGNPVIKVCYSFVDGNGGF